MFRADRWANAFVIVCKDETDEALLCLKALSAPLNAMQGAVFGHTAAKKIEHIMRESSAYAASYAAANDVPGMEYAIRFITLLIKKNYVKYIDEVTQRIEQLLDAKKGILNVSAESAFPLDAELEEELKKSIMEKTKSAGIKMKVNVVPELLGGYRLRLGGFYVDASLKGQLDKMTADLANASLPKLPVQSGG